MKTLHRAVSIRHITAVRENRDGSGETMLHQPRRACARGREVRANDSKYEPLVYRDRMLLMKSS
jgi:hypothetical protein